MQPVMIPCLDPDRPLNAEELEEERRELYPDELPTVGELIAYLSRMDPDTPVVLREDDAPADGPCVTLEDVLYELTPVSDDTRSYGPQGRR
jgi:hypothetical protein